MSIYIKLQQVRNELSKRELKKSGKNKHMGFNYFELGDFLPAITELCEKYKICSILRFGEKLATLKIVDAEKESSYVKFTTPIKEAKLAGNASPIQQLGATQTYIRRYLYMNAFEVVDNDIVDAQNQKDVAKEPPVKKVLTDAQIKRLQVIRSKAGYTEEEVKARIKELYDCNSTKELSKTQYDKVCKGMEANPKNREETK